MVAANLNLHAVANAFTMMLPSKAELYFVSQEELEEQGTSIFNINLYFLQIEADMSATFVNVLQLSRTLKLVYDLTRY